MNSLSQAVDSNSILSRRVSVWRDGSPPHRYGLSAPLLQPGAQAAPDPYRQAPTEKPLQIDVSSRFGRRLRELRRGRSLTQAGMAKKFGIDRSFISDVERGRKSISLPMLEILALGLEMSLSDLFQDL